MSKIRLEYEILVSGIYPFEGTFEKCDFRIVKNRVDDSLFNSLAKESVIYISPFIGMCCYPDETGVPVYLTFQKEELIEVDYGNKEEYDLKTTNKFIESLGAFDKIDLLEKSLILEVNNDIKFPAKVIKVYDNTGKFITLLANFMKLNVPSLLNCNKEQVLEICKRQNNRLSSGFDYDKITELAESNKYFKNALSMYHASFSVSDHQVGFMLLVIALESLLGLDTYAEPEKCECCGQKKYAITKTISENVAHFLMDENDVIKKRMKKLYDIRSKFVHKGKDIPKQNEQELQEYVRKVLLMYWIVSMNNKQPEHGEIIKEIQSQNYKNSIMYRNFLTAFDNTPFQEKRIKILTDTCPQVLTK